MDDVCGSDHAMITITARRVLCVTLLAFSVGCRERELTTSTIPAENILKTPNLDIGMLPRGEKACFLYWYVSVEKHVWLLRHPAIADGYGSPFLCPLARPRYTLVEHMKDGRWKAKIADNDVRDPNTDELYASLPDRYIKVDVLWK